MIARAAWSLAAVAVGATLLFGLDPDLDLRAAAAFYKGHNTFVAQTSVGEAVRRGLYWIPTVVTLLYAGLFLVRRFGNKRWWSPSGRGLIFVAVSFAVGPGLIVNGALKDHSHRPRPYQTVEFGGADPFEPFYRFDGACIRNCSFVSGEGAASVWTLAPALLLPPPARVCAVAASLMVAITTSVLRMAFGGHYLSDTIFAALVSGAVILLCWRLVDPPELRAFRQAA